YRRVTVDGRRDTRAGARCSCPDLFFDDTATAEIYTLSLHDALPISSRATVSARAARPRRHAASSSPVAATCRGSAAKTRKRWWRSEEHTSELQSRGHLVCRLLLEKKNRTPNLSNPHRTATDRRARAS